MYADATPEESAAIFQAHGEFGQAAGEAGVFAGGDGLQPTPTATTVRVRDGERMLTDGPYAETKEQLGGFYALECKDLDEALDVGGADPRGQDRRDRGPPGDRLRRARGGSERRAEATA